MVSSRAQAKGIEQLAKEVETGASRHATGAGFRFEEEYWIEWLRTRLLPQSNWGGGM